MSSSRPRLADPKSGCDVTSGCFGHIQPKMAHLQPSIPMYFGCDGHIQSKMLELQPSSHVREKSGAICKIHAKYSARAARSLAMQIRKSLPESHPRVTSMQISEDESHLSTSQSHPGVTSAKNSEASHIRWSHPRVTSEQNPVTSRAALPGATLGATLHTWRILGVEIHA